ncbi:MAG: DUF2911 domain-containing protein [Ferruginibacter sp.]
MKPLFILLLTLPFFSGQLRAQAIPPLDKSPMDMSTYPANFAGMKAQGKTVEPLLARVIYSRPQKNNRVVFGELVEYNNVWRFGANENTEIEFFSDVKISNVKIKKGRYVVFAIPAVDKWTIIINKDLNAWGSFRYNMSNDLVRITVPVQKTTEIAESFYIYFEKATPGYKMIAGWDNLQVALPISM